MGWLRHMKTTQELRAVESANVDQLPFRGKRRNLPTLWDDFFVRAQRTWKRHRKTKYRVIRDMDVK